jgi:mitochondrial intermediate peptidase
MKRSITTSWTCAQCILKRQTSLRRAGPSYAAVQRSQIHSKAGAGTLDHKDDLLRNVFDSQSIWWDFSKASRQSPGHKSTGLLQNVYLDSPEGFQHFAQASLEKCRRVVSKVLGISTQEGYRNIVKDLDRLSDLLCRIIDLSDFVRSTHPNPAFQHEASQAHALMYEYMNTLNTTTGLNDQLKRALKDPEVTKHWTEEETKVAEILRKDFAQSAIDLPAAKRQRFIELSNTIQELGSRFIDEMRPNKHFLSLDVTRLKGVSPLLLRELSSRRGKVELPTVGSAAAHILRYADDSEIRKDVYIASRTAASTQMNLLEQLLQTRAQLAELSGFDSYAAMSLTDKMARTPTAVVRFLEALGADNSHIVQDELKQMQELKQVSSSVPEGIKAWDRDYYRAQLSRAAERADRLPDHMTAFFSLGTVMQGLSRLFSHLYGVRFEPAEPLPGETWTPEVRRLNVIDENEGLIAVIYCDLFARSGKSPNPAHFTLRCSRLISTHETDEVDQTLGHLAPDAPAGFLANDGMAITHNADGSINQLPVIALICDFPPPTSSTPPLLPLSHLTTLFHEMGHAIHSVLGRTKLQNVAGTRCATDFAELPSVLMERFATHPDVLGLYARHWETNTPLPPEKAVQLHRASQHKSATARAADAADTEAQVRLALLDQAFHARKAIESPNWNTDAVMHQIDAAHASVPEPHDTRWQGFFGHLVGYGGSYYAYLFDRAIASKVWDVVFAGGEPTRGGPVQREAGERFRKQVLRWGGSRDGWACVSGVLGEEGIGLENGGEGAMAKVGQWGL